MLDELMGDVVWYVDGGLEYLNRVWKVPTRDSGNWRILYHLVVHNASAGVWELDVEADQLCI